MRISPIQRSAALLLLHAKLLQLNPRVSDSIPPTPQKSSEWRGTNNPHLENSCQRELALCAQSTDNDIAFEDLTVQWHAECDSRVPTVTTPPTAVITASLDPGACSELYISCESALFEITQCSQSETIASSLLSCVCQPKIANLRSECAYDGNISCVLTTADTSNILGYSICLDYVSWDFFFFPGSV
jgi:hypothetical protein